MLKKIISFIFISVLMVGTILNVSALPQSITLTKSPGKTGKYIAGVRFDYKMDVDGTYLYCLNMHKKTAQSTTANLVQNSNLIDGGVLYIIQNGYPHKSITGEKDKDYYITQTAVWWYLDETRGTQNLGEQFKQSGSDTYGLRSKVKSLVQAGLSHKNDPINTAKEPKITLSTQDDTLSLSGDYYISKEIKASLENATKYTIELKNAPAGTVIIRNDNTTSTNNKIELPSSQAFKIKVPTKNLSSAETKIKVEATAIGETQYEIAEYQPVNSNMQNVAKVVPKTSNASHSLELSIAPVKVSITKIDSSTRQPLAGAVLVLQDESGKELTRWTTTINAHIIKNLGNGTYKLVEESAPVGYVLNKNPITFKVTDDNRNISLSFENTPKKVVINITKVDQETKQPLAGATMQIKDSAGEIVYKFVTGTEAEILTDIEYGTYTLEEVAAPAGYIKSDRIVKFTVDEDHESHQIIFENAKEVPVPDTASKTSITIIIGLIISSIGFVYIKKHAYNK